MNVSSISQMIVANLEDLIFLSSNHYLQSNSQRSFEDIYILPPSVHNSAITTPRIEAKTIFTLNIKQTGITV